MRNCVQQYFRRGWCRFDRDPQLKDWVAAALPHARAALSDPELAHWYRYQNTWFAGVNALANDHVGRIGNSAALGGAAVAFIERELGLSGFVWDAAQVSVCFPGYPRPMPGESPARTQFRRDRDAAHVDGLLPEGPDRRRHLREHHGFILGIPMVECDPHAAPFVVWEGSHEIMRSVFAACFDRLDAASWGDEDVTEVYHAARERAFNESNRVEIHASPGQAFLVHRLALHGTAPWRSGASATTDGRMIVYFRPAVFGPSEWLNQP